MARPGDRRGVRRPAAAGAGSHGAASPSPRWSSPTRRTSSTSPATTPGRSTPRSACWSPADGPPHLFARAMDAAGAAYTCNLARRPHPRLPGRAGAPARTCTPSTGSPPPSATLVPAGELVGVECDAHFFSPRAYFALQRGLPANRLVDSAELVNWVRVVKSPHEVAAAADRGHHRRTRDAHRVRSRAARPAAVRRRRRDHGRTGHRNPRARRRLPGDRADAADRRGGRNTASDLDRPALRDGRSHHHRAGRRVRPLPRAAGADGDARRAAAASSPRPRR